MDLRLTLATVTVALAAAAAGGAPAAADGPVLRLDTAPESAAFGTVVAEGLDPEVLAALVRRGENSFRVYTGSELPADADWPPVAGSWTVEGDMLRFRPRFPFIPGVDYVARLDLGSLSAAGNKPIVASFSLPRPAAEPSTVVRQVYPTASVLPENQLRLYLWFSAPMSRGEARDHVRLVDSRGRDVEAPFLEVGEELWDPSMRRLTLFFDPGRIKRGLRPHLEAGPPLRAGESYRLVIGDGWIDAEGLPLAAGFVKSFTAAAADREAPDPADWRLESPAAGSRNPLLLSFPEPLDHGLLSRVVRVRRHGGELLAGRIEIADEERLLRFEPAEPWRPDDYAVEVETILEDLAGNNLRGVFDRDLSSAPRSVEERDTVALRFTVGPG